MGKILFQTKHSLSETACTNVWTCFVEMFIYFFRTVVLQSSVYVYVRRPSGFSTPPSPLSSRHSSQDSLHRHTLMSSTSTGMIQHVQPYSTHPSAAAAAVAAQQHKKKGIKSSLGRFFSKKEKVSGGNLIFNSLFKYLQLYPLKKSAIFTMVILKLIIQGCSLGPTILFP